MDTTNRTRELRHRAAHRLAPLAVAAALCLAGTQVAAAGPAPWSRPLTGRLPISCAYGVDGDWLAGHHTGVDFAVPEGTPVRSVGSGRVLVAGPYGDYGNAVTLRLSDGHYALFAHLSRVSVQVGRRVGAGTLLGYSGATGRVTGPHLHFEIRTRNAYGADVDPIAYLADHGVRLSTRSTATKPASPNHD